VDLAHRGLEIRPEAGQLHVAERIDVDDYAPHGPGLDDRLGDRRGYEVTRIERRADGLERHTRGEMGRRRGEDVATGRPY
jgi:hypothetical protein